MNYNVWKLECNEDTFQMIEVFDEKDTLEVQQEFVNKGFVIEETFKVKNRIYIRVCKVKSEVEE